MLALPLKTKMKEKKKKMKRKKCRYHEGAIPLLRIYSGAVFPPFLKETLTTLPNPIYQS